MPPTAPHSADKPPAHGALPGDTPLTPQQHAAIHTQGVSVVLSAGAGCGKTFVLTQRFMSHLAPAGPDAAEPVPQASLGSLVAITFTERAAREMRERIRAECARRICASPAAVAPHWLQIAREMDSARISTIHAFCAALLRSHAVEANLDPRFGLLDQTTTGPFLRRATADAVRDLLVAEDADCMDLIFEFGLEKTRGLIELMIADRSRIEFRDWLALSGEDLAARWRAEWRDFAIPALVRRLIDSDAALCTERLLTAHAPSHAAMLDHCQAVLAALVGLRANAQPEPLLDELVAHARVQGGGGKKAWPSDAIYEQVKTAFEGLRTAAARTRQDLSCDEQQVPLAATLGVKALRVVERACRMYDRRKRDAGLLDFDDLLSRARDLLRDSPSARDRAAAGISHLMVDEFQDTDPVQAEIVRALCGDELLRGKLFLVGDAKQSIYRFRRAEPRVFHELRGEIPAAGRLPLSLNFRSQAPILSFVNALFDGALHAGYEPLAPHRPRVSPEPCIEFLISAPDAAAAPGQAFAAERRTREADWIARRLHQLLHDGVARIHQTDSDSGPLARCAAPRDVVILFKAMSDVRYYEAALRNWGLDYYVVGGRAFYAQQEVADVVNLCRCLAAPDDDVSLAGVLRSPFFALSDDTLFALVHEARSLGAALRQPVPAHLGESQQRQVEHARRVLDELRTHKDRLPIAALLNLAIERTGYDAALLAEFLGERKLANLRKLIGMARQFDQAGLFTLPDFVQQLTDAVNHETNESLAATHPESSNVIRLMSIHQSKGLEFPIVVVADMDRAPHHVAPAAALDHRVGPVVALGEKFGEKRENLGLKLLRLHEAAEDAQENLRLLYVAATRAADLLILSANLKQPGCVTQPWLKLVEARFELASGMPRTDPETGASLIPERSRADVPEIRVHATRPEPALQQARARRAALPLKDFRATFDAAEPASLPASLERIFADPDGRWRFNVSQIETHDETLRRRPAPAGARRNARATTGPRGAIEPFQVIGELARDHAAGVAAADAEQFGRLVHALFERVNFAAPGDLSALLEACCNPFQTGPPRHLHVAAQRSVAEFVRSPAGREIARARRCFREIEFMLHWPAAARPAAQQIVTGTIDCLYQAASGAWVVIDYKTSALHQAADAKAKLEQYAVQLGVYCLAVRQMLGQAPDRVELALVGNGVQIIALTPGEAFLNDVACRVNAVLDDFRRGESETKPG